MTSPSAVVGFTLACLLAASAGSGGTGSRHPSSPVNSRSTAQSQSCRTYIAAGTNTTRASGFSARVTFTSTHDPNTHQTRVPGSYSDTRGIRQTWTQVTTYRSAADVVDEAEVIPPLTLSVGTTSTGDIAYTLTNAYDSKRRLTGFTNASAGGTITVRYTAWDNSGRPTAGTMTGPSSTSRLVLSYDNAARTLRTATTTNGVVSVGTQSFDADGNPAVYTATTRGAQASTTTTTTTIQSAGRVCK